MIRSQPLTRRTALRRSVLARKSPLRSRVRPRTPEPGREAWKAPRWGRCENCGQLAGPGPLHGHHVFARQMVARAGGEEFDPRNRMDLCPTCHMEHEFGQANRKIVVERIPAAALVFGLELLGADRVAEYLRRHYALTEAGTP